MLFEGEISEDFLFAIKKGIIKKYLHSWNYSEYDLEFFFLFVSLLFSNSHGIPFKFHFLERTKKLWFLCLYSSCSMTQNNIIDESFFFRGWNNIYQFSVSHKFSISTVTFLFVSRRYLVWVDVKGERESCIKCRRYLNFVCFSHDFRGDFQPYFATAAEWLKQISVRANKLRKNTLTSSE